VGRAVKVVTPSSSTGYSATCDTRLLSRAIGIAIETADMLVYERCRMVCDRRRHL
jgi:hypothetical protein